MAAKAIPKIDDFKSQRLDKFGFAVGVAETSVASKSSCCGTPFSPGWAYCRWPIQVEMANLERPRTTLLKELDASVAQKVTRRAKKKFAERASGCGIKIELRRTDTALVTRTQ